MEAYHTYLIYLMEISNGVFSNKHDHNTYLIY